MNKEVIFEFLAKNKGKIAGVFLGLIFSILVLVVGFFKTIFIIFCSMTGFYLGSRVDNKEDILDIIQKLIPNEWK